MSVQSKSGTSGVSSSPGKSEVQTRNPANPVSVQSPNPVSVQQKSKSGQIRHTNPVSVHMTVFFGRPRGRRCKLLPSRPAISSAQASSPRGRLPRSERRIASNSGPGRTPLTLRRQVERRDGSSGPRSAHWAGAPAAGRAGPRRAPGRSTSGRPPGRRPSRPAAGWPRWRGGRPRGARRSGRRGS